MEVRSVVHDLVVIHEEVTSYLHILVNEPFKDHVKQLYSTWLSAQVHVLTPPGKQRGPA
jgi:hypothetical protein